MTREESSGEEKQPIGGENGEIQVPRREHGVHPAGT
jgi:hypothetical protein